MLSCEKPAVLGEGSAESITSKARGPANTLIASEVLGLPCRSLAALRNDPLTPKIRKHPKEHLLGVHQVVESETAGFAGIGDDIVVGPESPVRVPPRRNLLEAKFLQSVLFDDFLPDRPLVRHRPRKVDVSWRRQLPSPESGEFGAYILPP